MKIQIIGYSGSGKSTLAAALGRICGVPVLHLDTVKFYGNWQERSEEEQTATVEQFLAENEGWVIDGNYTAIAPERFAQSDMTVYMNFNRVVCFLSAWRRYRKYRGRARGSCPCPEKFDKEFRRWVWRDGRTAARKQKHMENLRRTSGAQVILKNRRQANRFLKDFEKKYGENSPR